MAKLIPSLVLLRATFDDLLPARKRASDGWIGDARHQQEHSDHNPDSRGLVHAIDVDNDLGEGADMQAFCNFLVGRCRSGAEKRLTYVIYNRRIASASHGWVWRAYDGKSPHTEHAHFSASHTPALEQNTTSWHLEEVPVALTADDKKWLTTTVRAEVAAQVDDIAKAVWDTQMTRPDGPARPGGSPTTAAREYLRYRDVVERQVAEAAADRVIAALKR